MREAYKGNFPNSPAVYVLQTHLELGRLKELGFTFDVDDFDPDLIEALSIAGAESKRIEAEKRRRKKKGRK